jgi:serine/threonine protein kinase
VEHSKHILKEVAVGDVHQIPSAASSIHLQESNVALKVQIVMELCECGSLRDLLQDGAFNTSLGLNYQAVLDTALDIAKGMAHLHSMGLVHSDLKVN